MLTQGYNHKLQRWLSKAFRICVTHNSDLQLHRFVILMTFYWVNTVLLLLLFIYFSCPSWCASIPMHTVKPGMSQAHTDTHLLLAVLAARLACVRRGETRWRLFLHAQKYRCCGLLDDILIRERTAVCVHVSVCVCVCHTVTSVPVSQWGEEGSSWYWN